MESPRGIRGLTVRGLDAGYGNKRVVADVTIDVQPSRITVLLGHNGAGKTTTMLALFGLLPVKAGTIDLDGTAVQSFTTRERVARGMGFVPAERFVFPDLTVSENLALGQFGERDHAKRAERHDWAVERWPILAERRTQLAGTLSGGQRRILSLAIALMAGPRVLLLDEPSLGLAPNVVDRLFSDLRSLADEQGMSILLVEQNVAKALALADDAYVMRSGRIIEHAPASELAARDSLWELF